MYRGVQMIGNVTYKNVDDEGLHVDVGDESRTFKADTIILCAGQERADELLAELETLGVPVHCIGGAKDPRELDAVHAFEDGTRLALSI